VKNAMSGGRAPGFSPGRRLQLMVDPRNDPYRARSKPRGSAYCPECGLVCLKGRWQQGERPEGAQSLPCPACRRIRDDFAAGIVTVTGPFAYEHREEVLQVVRNLAQRVQADHPLERIIRIEEAGEKVVVTTTDVHLAQAIGKALLHAFSGRLNYAFSEGEYRVRVDWAA
jgi:hypothetical protein